MIVSVSGESATESNPNVAGDNIHVSVAIEDKSANAASTVCNYEITSGYYFNGDYYDEHRLGVNSFGEASSDFAVPSPGSYSVFFRGIAGCNIGSAETPALAYSSYAIDVKTPAFLVVKESVPIALKIAKVTCAPQFKISQLTEYTYVCAATIIDKSHVADFISMSPAAGTPLYAGDINSRNTSKSWKRISSGWIVTSKFKLLTVSPADSARYRIREYFQVGVMVQDSKMDVKAGFNRRAEAAVVTPIFAFTKVTK